MKVAIVMTMWQRHAIVAETLDRLNGAATYLGLSTPMPDSSTLQGFPAIRLSTVVAGSEGTRSRELVERNGGIYIEVPNRPLSAKWNAAYARARLEQPDVAIMLGSDDWTTPLAIAQLVRAAADHGYAGVRDMYLYDLKSGRSGHWRGYEGPRFNDSLGALRTMRRDLLDRVGWRFFDKAIDRALDWEMKERLRRVGIGEPVIAAERCLLDVKGGGPNICTYDSIAPKRELEPGELDGRLGTGTTAALERLREGQAPPCP